ncbi:site-2 protease family protein [Patescibacteria group bacterium]|nr:site-2 protease family protein [Patescibacteria group bacterium]
MIIFLVIIALIFLIITHELGHFLLAKIFSVRVDEFGIGYPPKIASKKIGETDYSLNALPFGGFVRIAGMADEEGEGEVAQKDALRSFKNQSAPRRAAILFGGVFMNFLTGWLILAFVFMIGITPAIVITGIAKNSPAASVGIEAGDKINNFINSEKFLNFIDQHRGQPIILSIDRGGRELSLSVVPRVNPPQGEGAIGVTFAQTGIAPQPFFPALWNSLLQSLSLCWMILKTFGILIANLLTKASLLAGVVGPIGVFQVAEQASSLGFVFFFNLFALIALNLAVLNLLPLPALDGGHLLFVLIEKIKGSPVSVKIQAEINKFGLAFLIILMILISIRDISHLI